MNRRRSFVVSAALVLVLVLGVTPARAYTDPGTGALIWQMLVAASVGAVFYTRRILKWARGLMQRQSRPDASGPLPPPAPGESREAGQ